MVDVLYVLFGLGIILFLGYFAEFLFNKTHVPDVLILILIGFIIGPYVLKYVYPETLATFAPIFTTFTLLFLLFEGGLNLSIKSLVQGALKSMNLTLLNFFISAAIITIIMFITGFSILEGLLTGFILGGISSAFVIPIVRQLKIKETTSSVLTLESAFTDVFCIVFSFAVMEIIMASTVDFVTSLKTLVMLFIIAGVMGFIAGLIWIFMIAEVFKSNTSYMLTIAYVMLIYVISEFFGGNGAIASLFLGITLKNSRAITRNIIQFLHHEKDSKELEEIEGVMAVKQPEAVFYQQISFFLKTFFFVYIGILFSFSNIYAFIIGVIIAISILFSRKVSGLIIKDYEKYDQDIVKAIFARGLAAAAIAQVVMLNSDKIFHAEEISLITYTVIVFSIILSSGMIFYVNYKADFASKKKPTLATAKSEKIEKGEKIEKSSRSEKASEKASEKK
jgi:cell volume regulation protein A